MEKLRMKDITFEKIYNFDPFNKRADSCGMVSEWVGRNVWGNAVAFGNTKAECIADARRYINYENCQRK